jgi:hypothetical protein
MCVAHGRHLVIHGGRNNFVLDTAHVLDLMTRTWVDVSVLVVAAARVGGLHQGLADTLLPPTHRAHTTPRPSRLAH